MAEYRIRILGTASQERSAALLSKYSYERESSLHII